MTLMHSRDLPLGTVLPPFALADAFGARYQSAELFGPRGLLLVFTCNHCPYARAQWPRLVRLAQRSRGWGINSVAINSNLHPDYPDDAPARMKETVQQFGIDFPYLVDESQQVARDYKAQCTPDPYLFDAAGRLVYHGRIDDNWQHEGEVTRQELKEALQALAEGRPPLAEQHPSMGCSIKWRREGG